MQIIKDNADKIIIWFAVVAIPLIFSAKSADPDLYLRFAMMSVAMIAACVFIAFSANKITVEKMNVFLLLYIVFVIYTFSRTFSSINTGAAVFEWLRIFLTFLVFFIFVILFENKKNASALFRAFTFLCFILAFTGLIQLLIIINEGNLSIPLSTYRVSFFYGHRNLFVQMLAMSLHFALCTAVFDRKKLWRTAAVAALSVAIFVLIILSNRAAWIAISSGLAIIVFFHFRYYKRFKTDIKVAIISRKLLWLSLIASFIVTVISYTAFSDKSSIVSHTQGILDTDKGSAKDRIILWQKTIQLIEEKPVFGHGTGSWNIEILKYGNTGLVSEDNITFYQRPHNDFLWIVGETGISGFVLYSVLLMLILYFSIKTIIRSKQYEEFFFNLTLLSVLILFLVLSFFSFPKERIETIVVVSPVFALIYAAYYKNKVKTQLRSAFLIPLMLLLLIVMSFTGISLYRSDIHLRNALIAKDEKNYQKVIREINQAESGIFKIDHFATPLIWYRGSAYFNLHNTQKAHDDFKKAYELNPYHIHVLNNLGTTSHLLGDNISAEKYFSEAVKIAPGFEDAILNLSALYFNQGRIDEAYETIYGINNQTDNPRYRPFLEAILFAKLELIFENEPDAFVTIQQMITETDSLYKWHIESVENQTDLNTILHDKVLR